MFRCGVVAVLFLAIVSSVFAINFSPTVITLSSPAAVHYKFDGTDLKFDFTVIGKPVDMLFLVYTNGKSGEIGKIQNGYLGWHYINQVDTCAYIGIEGNFNAGKNTIVWDGKNNDKKTLPPDTYTYYLWGFDSMTFKQMAIGGIRPGGQETLEITDEKGMTLPNPIMYLNGTRKWSIGIDPQTPSDQLESTAFTEPGSMWPLIVLDPADHTQVYVQQATGYGSDVQVGNVYIRKYKWVPNGVATLVPDWADQGTFIWTQVPAGMGVFGYGLTSNGSDTIFATYCNQYDTAPVSDVLMLDMNEGTKISEIDLSKWYCRKDDSEQGGQMNGGPSNLAYVDGILYTHGLQSCIELALDPNRSEDIVVWVNGNGDYIHDINFQSDAPTPWMCNDFNHPPYMYGFGVDPFGFSAFPTADIGGSSFGLTGPDGTGIKYLAFLGETGSAWYTNGPQFLNAGTPFDGLYNDHPEHERAADGGLGVWYVAYDSVKGIITSSETDVAETTPGTFSVSQNSPNPFNRSTLIQYTLPGEARVTVSVYDASGQKVDTLINDYQSAGNHSLVWDASECASGIYFYTVTAGSFSKTVKMTYLK